jgi:GNAT superfamily N-acetyltransferase
MIAAAVPDDLPDLAGLMVESPLLQRYHVTHGGALASLSTALRAGDVVLCSRGGPDLLEGFAWMSFSPGILNGAAYLRLLLVARPSNGIGSRLLSAAEDAARARANHLYLLVTTDNARARRFYQRHGYRHVGDLPGLVWPDLDEALYHKALRSYAERLTG